MITTNDAQARAAVTLFGRSGVRLVRLEALSALTPLAKKSRLETHAELEIGTSRVRLGVSDQIIRMISSSASTARKADVCKEYIHRK